MLSLFTLKSLSFEVIEEMSFIKLEKQSCSGIRFSLPFTTRLCHVCKKSIFSKFKLVYCMSNEDHDKHSPDINNQLSLSLFSFRYFQEILIDIHLSVTI